jgi:hypothetical protein
MPYDFSFSRPQWWTIVAACVVVLALTFTIGFVAGLLWTRSIKTLENPKRDSGHVSGLASDL